MSWWVVLILQILNDQIWVLSCNGGSKNNPIFCRLCIWKPMVLRYHAVPHFSETPKWSKKVAGSHKIRSSKKSPTVTTSGWQTTSGHPTSGRLPARLDSGSKSPVAHGSCCGGSILISVGFKFLFWVADLNEFEWCNMLKSQDVGEILQNFTKLLTSRFLILKLLKLHLSIFPQFLVNSAGTLPGSSGSDPWSHSHRVVRGETLGAARRVGRSVAVKWGPGAPGPGAPPFWGWECPKNRGSYCIGYCGSVNSVIRVWDEDIRMFHGVWF